MAERAVTVRLKVNDDFSVSLDRYNSKIAASEQATKRMADASRTMGDRLKNLDNTLGIVMGGAVFGFGVNAVKNLAEGLYSAGMNAQRAEMLFASFGEQVGSTSALLERLRATTRGVVDDTTLMQAASTQLSMGLARNADDVERLTNIGVTFAQAMGQDVKSSMENLNMLLANQSYLRLDTLGISSSQVRTLAEQYRAAGMDSSEAFTAAFMDVAEAKLPQMAAVADAVVTPIQQLTAQWDNFWADFGDRFAIGVNSIIKLIDLLGEAIGNLPQYPEWTGIETPPGTAGSDTPAYRGYAAGTPQGVMDLYSMSTQMLQARQMFAPGSELYNEASRQIAQQNAALIRPYQEAMYDFTTIMAGGRGTTGGWWNAYSNVGTSTSMYTPAYRAPYGGATADALGNFNANNRLDNQRLMQFDNLLNQAMDGLNELRGLTGATTGMADDARVLAENVGSVIDEFIRLDELDPQFMTDDDLTIVTSIADEATRLADNAERLANMSLSDLFGQGSGGLLGQMADSVFGSIELTPEEQDILDLYTGRQTSTSLNFRDNASFFQDIRDQFGIEASLAAMERMATEFDRARTTPGYEPNYGYSGYTYALGPGGVPMGGAGGYTIQPGDTPLGIAAALGIPLDQVQSQMATDSPYLRIGDTLNFGGGGSLVEIPGYFQEAETAMQGAETSASAITAEAENTVSTLEKGFERIFATERTLTLSLDVKDKAAPDWLKQMIRAEWVSLTGGGFGGKSTSSLGPKG